MNLLPYPPCGSNLLACVDVANTVLVQAPMPLCACLRALPTDKPHRYPNIRFMRSPGFARKKEIVLWRALLLM
jgi:hypothetical protein